MLPTVVWDVDPIFLKLPREGVAITLGIVAAASFVYGLVKRQSDQLVSGVFFAILAGIVAKFLPENYGIRYYSLLFVFVFLGGHALLKWQIRRARGPVEDANDFIVYGVLGVLLGARLGHVLFYDLEKALQDPLWVFQIWTGGLASHGAVIGLITAMYLFTKSRGIPFIEGADRFAFSAALGATLVRVGNLLNSEIVGKQTDGTWGFRFVRFDGADAPLRHPSQLYEITLGLFVLGALFLIDRRLGGEKRPRGAMISSFFALYFTGRFIVEFFKEYEGISPDSPLRMGQILSLPGILLGFYGLYWSFKNRIPANWPGAEPLDDEDDADEEDEDEDADQASADDEDEDDDDSEDEDDADDTADEAPPARQRPRGREDEKRSAEPRVDPDIDEEFEKDGKLKRAPRE